MRQRAGGLRLWTFASNIAAQRFYERHGFIESERTAGDNEERAPDTAGAAGASTTDPARGAISPRCTLAQE